MKALCALGDTYATYHVYSPCPIHAIQQKIQHSTKSTHQSYGGTALCSNASMFWKVCIVQSGIDHVTWALIGILYQLVCDEDHFHTL